MADQEQTNTRKAQAQEIIQQLGGYQFLTMTGAQHVSFDGTAPTANVSFKIRGSKKVSHVTIELNNFDTYDVKFLKIRGMNYKIVKEYTGLEGLYNTSLREVFTQVTGLETSLGTMGR